MTLKVFPNLNDSMIALLSTVGQISLPDFPVCNAFLCLDG